MRAVRDRKRAYESNHVKIPQKAAEFAGLQKDLIRLRQRVEGLEDRYELREAVTPCHGAPE